MRFRRGIFEIFQFLINLRIEPRSPEKGTFYEKESNRIKGTLICWAVLFIFSDRGLFPHSVPAIRPFERRHRDI